MGRPSDGAHPVHDLVGIGLGPFNLGLACLAEPLPDVSAVFLEAEPDFSWHPGMLLPDAVLQVPFLADLVSLADPTSSYSFLAWLKETGRLYPFYVRESFYPMRTEYDAYCRWAAHRVEGVCFDRRVVRVEHDPVEDCYAVHSRGADGASYTHRGRRVVLGVGTPPHVPEAARGVLDDADVVHSADYLAHRDALLRHEHVTVVGSGQSAAEVFRDLLADPARAGALTWLTRSPRFFPLEYTKLTLEMTSPEYSRYFRGLPAAVRDPLLASQRGLYKGISGDVVDDVFDTLYRLGDDARARLLTGLEVTDVRRGTQGGYVVEADHAESGERLRMRTDALVLATGYAARVPDLLDPVRDRIRWDDQGRPCADEHYAVDHGGREIFVQNAEAHTHGFVAPDLGMGAHRSSVILARVTGRAPYAVEERIAVQEFGVPADLKAQR